MAVLEGRIIKGIAGFYYVDTCEGLFECHAKGLFRKDKIKPIVGDNVSIEILDSEKFQASLVDIHERKNSLIRPLVANVDQAVIVFAYSKPEPNLNILDKFLIMMRKHNIETVIIFNKEDLTDEKQVEKYNQAYKDSAAKLLTIQALNGKGVQKVRELLEGKVTVLAGPSGVGKSTLINGLLSRDAMETGEISEKLKRGKHTTRHSEIFKISDNSYIVDTPGFTSFDIEADLEKEDLKDYYPEFYPYEGKCRFEPCSHTHEPSCAVKAAVEETSISQMRYDNYIALFEEISNRRKY